jgi:hypothetical protein
MSYFPQTQIADLQYGTRAECTPMGELFTADRIRLVGTPFIGGTLDANFWLTTGTANGGAIALDSTNQAKLTTSTGTTGTAILFSARLARYISGASNQYRSQIQHGDAGTAGAVKKWGMFDGTNGAYFECDGTTFQLNTMRGSAAGTAVTSGNFNGKGGTTYALDTNCHTYEIYITNKTVRWVIDDVLIHTKTFSTDTYSATLTLPVWASITKASGAVDLSMWIRTMSISRLGALHTMPKFYHIATNETRILKRSAGHLHTVNVNGTGGAGNTLILYDDLSAVAGNMIATLDLNKSTISTLTFDIPFNNGLTYVSNSSVDCTISYE